MQRGGFGGTRGRQSHSSYSPPIAFQPLFLVSDQAESEMSFNTLLQNF